jgi:hypothetical protein
MKPNVFGVWEPDAIFLRVALAVLLAVKVTPRRLFAHVIEKILEGKPARVINSDPAPAIPFVVRGSRISTAGEHRLP